MRRATACTAARLAVAAALAAALAGCSGAVEPATSDSEPVDGPSRMDAPSEGRAPGRAAGDTYVALGDSYTAAPMVGPTDLAAGCFRGRDNYPALVAEALDLELVDVSCGGATTRHLAGEQETMTGDAVAPQLDAVTSETDLVTISIGGNDFDLFVNLVRGCDTASCADSELAGSPGDVRRTAAEVRARILEGIEAVRERAPDARIVVVGYPQVAPARATCPALPVAGEGARIARRVNEVLARVLAQAAATTGVDHVDVFAATAGHDLCSDDPWIADGSARPPEAAPYHPLAAEQEIVADLLVDLLAG